MGSRANQNNDGGNTPNFPTNTQPNYGGVNISYGTYITTFPTAGGDFADGTPAITVIATNAQMDAAGAQIGDPVERDSDGGFWDTNSGFPVPPEYTSLSVAGTMTSDIPGA